ncbi:DUF1640 domain-containing protein [Methylobacterium sp. WL6]|nr:DUF1640 domain-containing protein [Methylobacterium sp. WL6]TXN63246.1 DUF1640 domain-containing protein [Methylobacterium sp. WL6]
MNVIAFDTLKFARKLRENAHLTPEQAEGMADAMSEVFASGIPTKTDVADVRHDIEAFRVTTQADIVAVRHDIDALRLSTKADIATAKSDIIKWMFGMIGFQTVAILGAVVALVRSLH